MLKNIINKDIVMQSLSQICFGMLGALLILAIFHKNTPTIATVNITGLQDSFIKETSKQSLSDEEKKQKVEIFANKLNQSIIQIAKEKNAVILLNEAVISNHADFTQEVAKEIKRGLSQ